MEILFLPLKIRTSTPKGPIETSLVKGRYKACKIISIHMMGWIICLRPQRIC